MSDLKYMIKLAERNATKILTQKPNFLSGRTYMQAVETMLAFKVKHQLVPKGVDADLVLLKLANDMELSAKEQRAVPFALFSPKCDSTIFKNVFRHLDLKNAGLMRRFFYVYLTQYDAEDGQTWRRQKQDFVAKLLGRYFQSKIPLPRNRLLQMGVKYHYLFFTQDALHRVALFIPKCGGVHACYQQLGLPRGLYGCAYFRSALQQMFLTQEFSAEAKFSCFQELLSQTRPKGEQAAVPENHNTEIYAQVFPAAASGIIPAVDRMEATKRADYKKQCVDIFYALLGDPRFGDKKIRWGQVDAEAHKIFLRWLAENDLNLFFSIIAQTAVDAMWRYRKEFWQQYLPYITNTWVFFGKEAESLMQRTDHRKTGYGRLGRGCIANQSAFAFQIGQHVFVEWSHNGKLRVWQQNAAPDVFGKKSLDKSEILYRPCEEEWVHSGKENNHWQNRVSWWLAEYCQLQL